MTTSPREAAELLARHGLAPRRALGQNFVVDPNTVRRIARLAGVGPGDRVVEIGAGLGALTVALVETGAAVTAVEVDRGLRRRARASGSAAGACASSRATPGASTGPPCSAAHGGWVLVANLPYNVATPLVADLLDDVPAVAAHAGDGAARGGRAAGGRRPGDDAYGAVSVKVAYWATASVVGRVPPTVFLPRPKVESALVAITRRPEPAVGPDVDRDGLFALVRAGFGQRRKMLRRSLAGAGRRRATSRPPASGPRPGPRSWAWPTGAGWRRWCRPDEPESTRAGAGQADAVAAGHGRPPRRLPPARRRDGHPRPGRHAHLRRGRRPARRRAGGRRRARRRRQPRAPGAAGRRPHRRACTSTSGSRPAAAWAAARPTPPPCCGGPGATTWPWPSPSAPTCPFCLRGGRARVTGIGEVVEPLPIDRRHLHAVHAAVRGLDGGGVPALGRARRPDGAPGPTTSSRRPSRSSPGWPSGATGCGAVTGRTPVLAGSGATWFVEGDFGAAAAELAPATVVVTRTDRPEAALGAVGAESADADVGGELLVAALEARALQHLLVLLLAHALAALLDQRTHTKRRGYPAVRPWRKASRLRRWR